MALFLDGPPTNIDDLTGFDSQLLDVASMEQIDVTRKLAIAHEELTVDLQAWLARSASRPAGAALETVVVTPALKLWHAYRSLEMVYSDAYSSQLNDRYAGRRDQFKGMARWAREKLIETGLGMATAPVPQASMAEITPTTGTLPDGTYYLTVTYLNSGGDEGRCAPAAAVASTSGGIALRMTYPPAGIAKWNVFAGTAPDDMTLQTPQGLALDQQWLITHPLDTSGRQPAEGQAANTVQVVARILLRG